MGIFEAIFGPRQEIKYVLVNLLKKNIKICNFCKGNGWYYTPNSPRLSCHRCIDGVTTPDREKTAEELEKFYRSRPWSEVRNDANNKEIDEIMERYKSARSDDDRLRLVFNEINHNKKIFEAFYPRNK